MADEPQNEDTWLYGDNSDNIPKESENDKRSSAEPEPESEPQTEAEPEPDPQDEAEPDADDVNEKNSTSVALPFGDGPPGVDDPLGEEREEGEVDGRKNDDESDKEDLDEDSDDDVNVVIGDIKSTPSYAALNVKRSTLVTTGGTDKTKQTVAKFTPEEFEQVGTINGEPSIDFNIDSLEEKAWRKPGADITDYFNYGFNEETWRAYCERQKRIRVGESGIGVQPLNSIGLPRGSLPISNDNSKYANNFSTLRKAGPPPQRRSGGTIEVLGEQPKENQIQVMTADRREYSKKPGFPDMSVPPPHTSFEVFPPEYSFNAEPEMYYGGYEPTQDCQWAPNHSNWAPVEIKSLTPGPIGPHPNMHMGPPMIVPVGGRERSPSVHHRSEERVRDRDRESKSRSERDRSSERSHRRERSRSRSRRHKSRSRSPGHRSHKKKKSRRHDDRESE